MKTLYLCGAGNSEGVRLALGINAQQARWERIFLLDDDSAKRGRKILGVEVLGPFDLLRDAERGGSEVANLVARTTVKRGAAREKIAAHGHPFASLVHPSVDTLGAELAQDVTVYPNATVGPEVTLGEGAVVFMGAIAGHEARVGRCCVLAANSVLNARVELGDGVYVGTNASVLPETKVGIGATIGAGSVVLEDVPAKATVMGVPAHIFVPPPSTRAQGPPVSRAAPVNPVLENTLLGIWSEVLEVAVLAPEENFFDLGGSSLLALRLRRRIEAETGCSLAATDLFRFPTVRALAAHLGGGGRSAGPATSGASRGELRRRLRARSAGVGS